MRKVARHSPVWRVLLRRRSTSDRRPPFTRLAALLLELAQMEREHIRERQATGIAAAKARGKRWGGRKPGSRKVDPRKVREVAERGLRQIDIARALGIHRHTVARVLNEG